MKYYTQSGLKKWMLDDPYVKLREQKLEDIYIMSIYDEISIWNIHLYCVYPSIYHLSPFNVHLWFITLSSCISSYSINLTYKPLVYSQLPQGTLGIWRHFWGKERVSPASSEQRPGMLLNILQCTGNPFPKKSHLAPSVNNAAVRNI